MTVFFSRCVLSNGLRLTSSLKPVIVPATSFARSAFSGISEDTVISTCTRKITELLNPVRLKVTSTNDDPNGSHIQIDCVSEAFDGKSRIQRQRLVYKAIWDELNGPVHAVDSIVAKTPKEVGL